MPNLARDILISEPEAGHVISAYALGVVVGGMAIAAGFGWASTGSVGAVMAVSGLALFMVSVLRDKRASRWQPLDTEAQLAE